MKRQEMLSRIRNALDKNELEETSSAVPKIRLGNKIDLPTPSRSSNLPSLTENLSQLFILAAKKNGTALIEVEDRKNIPLKLKGYFSEISTPHYSIRCFDNEILGLPWASERLVIDSGAVDQEDKIGLSLAWGGIAETGTVILISSASNPTSLSFLPEIHIVFLKVSRIFNSLEDGFDQLLKAHERQRFPHAINLISGASRTGDIGGHIVHGAHGPTRLCVILLKNE